MMRYIEHTSDIGFEVEEDDLKGLFSTAAIAMYGLMVDPFSIEQSISRNIEIQSEDMESLMFDWIDELIFLFESENVVLREFDLFIDDYHIDGSCRGGIFDPSRHESGIVVKAVTYHMMEVKKKSGGWYARVILDV